jgi:hypothetical protein
MGGYGADSYIGLFCDTGNVRRQDEIQDTAKDSTRVRVQ